MLPTSLAPTSHATSPQSSKFNYARTFGREGAPADGYGRDTAGLGDRNRTTAGVASTVEDLGELGALAGAGLAYHHDHRVRLHGGHDLVLVLRDWQHRRPRRRRRRHGRGVLGFSFSFTFF